MVSHRVLDAGKLENCRRVKDDRVDACEGLKHHQHDADQHRPPMREHLVFVARSDDNTKRRLQGG